MSEFLVRVFPEGDAFCAVTGDEAIAGFGSSPAAALRSLAAHLEAPSDELDWQEGDTEVVDDLMGLECSINALLYYQYRQAGCPFGQTSAGVQAWVQTAIEEPFANFVDSIETGELDADR